MVSGVFQRLKKNFCNSFLKSCWTCRDYLSNTVSTSIISWHEEHCGRQSDPIPDILLEGQNQLLYSTKASFWRKTTKRVKKNKENLKAQVTLICFKSRGKKVWNNPTFGSKCKCVHNPAVSVHLWATGEAWEEAQSQGRKHTLCLVHGPVTQTCSVNLFSNLPEGDKNPKQ